MTWSPERRTSWLLYLLAITATVAALDAGFGLVSGRVEPPGCIAEKCCDGVWTLTCPPDAVDAPLDAGGPNVVDCPDAECWTDVVPRSEMPSAAPWNPIFASLPDPRTDDDSPLSVGVCTTWHPTPGTRCRQRFCPAGACHELDLEYENY